MHFRRKIAGSAPQYKKPVWICHTFNQRGKSHCASRQIPESLLMELAADVLGIPHLLLIAGSSKAKFVLPLISWF